MLVFLIIYLTGFWFFKTYNSRWIYWLSIMVLYPMLMATFGSANPGQLLLRVESREGEIARKTHQGYTLER
jgi:hypothetical protein